VITDVYYQKGYPDPVFDAEYVLGLVRPFVPDAKEVTGVDETGGEARTYAIDEGVILKVQRPQQLRLSTSLAREVFFLNTIAGGDESISVPRVLGYGKSGTVEYTVMTRMQGRALRYADLAEPQREAVYENLGKTLAKIHKLDANGFAASGHFPDVDKPEDIRERLTAWFYRVVGWIKNGRPSLAQTEIDAAAARVSRIIEKVPDAEDLRALHSNPGQEHVFVTEAGEFSGLIDFGDAYISHPACDFRSTPLKDRAAMLRGYKTVAGTSKNFAAIWDAVCAIDTIVQEMRS